VPALDLAAARAWIGELAERPRRAIATTAVLLAVAGLLLAGVVAGLLAAVYGALTARALLRRSARRRASAARARSLDDLCALAADLRAGLAPAAIGNPGRDGAERRIAELTTAVWRLAERTGAPAADLVERIEADARAADRAHASAAAQAAGAQATALLLAALPLGGIGLGYGIGVDPLQTLLHTTLGGGCALGAALLQSVGLLWADRLATGPAR
jgi:tight adherence protein B